MKKYLALDSGGSKVTAILYDEDFCPLDFARTGSMRTSSTPAELIHSHLEQLADALSLKNTRVDRVVGTFEPRIIKGLSEFGVDLGQLEVMSEFRLGMSAAGLFGDGMLALAGTGATFSAQYKGNEFHTGGFGSVVFDEGSGYWIGRSALGAAIRDWQGRGPHTLLKRLVAEYLGSEDDFRGAIFGVYRREGMSPVTCVASCAPLVSQAAKQGDQAACDILCDAGRFLGEQLVSLVNMNGLPHDLPFTVSGSVWKSHHLLFDAFCNAIEAGNLASKPIIPYFEPIIGAIISHCHDLCGYDKARHERFMKMYGDYIFKIN